jgi:cell division protein ZapE
VRGGSRVVSVAERFNAYLAAQGWQPDESQSNAAERLDQLAHTMVVARRQGQRPTLLGRLLARGRPTAPRGLYLWGGVGRGKTLLVDLFVAEVGGRTRRSHFHRFMQEVHARLNTLRATATVDPVAELAHELSGEADLLCFDELFVKDIADAMILGALFKGLRERGVTLVVTSNTPPSGLYKDGLQRNRFLPTIALLEEATDVVEVDGGTDYRLRALRRAPVFTICGELSDNFLNGRFQELSMGPPVTDTDMEIEGRAIKCRKRQGGIAWFDFSAICLGPRGTDDYIFISRQFHTVIVSNVPALSNDDNAARRFISMIDEFYERSVKLLLSTAVPIDALYAGDRLAFDFRRTISRLTEMQSESYLGLPHRP